MAKIQTVNDKIANLIRKGEKLQDDRDGETAEDGSPTAEEADDE